MGGQQGGVMVSWGMPVVAGAMAAGFFGLFWAHVRAENAKLRRELEQMNGQEALGTLASGVAHDFNNILGAILGFSVLLEDDLIAQPEQREMAAQVSAAARRGQGIVRQLMSYGRKNAGDTAAQGPVDLDAVVRETMEVLRPGLHDAHALTYSNRASASGILGNATQLGQVVLNLCINAGHAIGARPGEIGIALEDETVSTPRGGEGISFSGGAGGQVTLVNGRLAAGDYLRLSVRDNGAGMTADVARRIFDPFFTTKDVGKGTGLGLAAVQGIVHGHGGAIVVTTRHFKGTSFSLYFPVRAQARATPPVQRVSR